MPSVGLVTKYHILITNQVAVSRSANGNVTSTLTVNKVNWEDEGNYSCIAQDNASKEHIFSHTVHLHIKGICS